MPARRGAYVSRGPARLPRPSSSPPRLHSRPTMRKSALSLLCASLLAAVAAAGCRDAARPPRHVADLMLPEDGQRFEGTIGRGDTFASLLQHHQVPDEERQAVLGVVERAFSSRHLRAHQPYTITLGPEGHVRELTYRIDPDRFLQVLPAFAPAKAGASAGEPTSATDATAPARFTTEIVSYRR